MTYEAKTINIGQCKITVRYEAYDSAIECVEDLKKRSVTDAQFQRDIVSPRKNWHGVASYEEALDLLHNGYQPVVNAFKESININKESDIVRNEKYISPVGFQPVVPLYLTGSPCNMVAVKKKRPQNPVVNIYYDMGANCSYNPGQFILAGERMLAAIIEIERRGYRVNLYSVQGYVTYNNINGRTNDMDIMSVKIKDSSQPFDLKRMSFALTHPAFFRVLGFDWYSKAPNAKYRVDLGYPLGQALHGKLPEFATHFFKNGIAVCCTDLLNIGEEAILKEFNKKNTVI